MKSPMRILTAGPTLLFLAFVGCKGNSEAHGTTTESSPIAELTETNETATPSKEVNAASNSEATGEGVSGRHRSRWQSDRSDARSPGIEPSDFRKRVRNLRLNALFGGMAAKGAGTVGNTGDVVSYS